MEQICFIVGFCRVRYAHTASPTPRPKMGFAIFRLCPPSTLRVSEQYDLLSECSEKAFPNIRKVNRDFIFIEMVSLQKI